MRRRIHKKFKIAIVLLCIFLLSACSKSPDYTAVSDACVLITKSAGNPYNTHMASGFSKIVEESERKAAVLEPEKATVEEQISMIRGCIRARAKSISIAANDANALDSVLSEALEAGIIVSTVDSDTGSNGDIVFVNQVDAEELARCLADAVYELADGAGAWAILSTTNQMGNQSTWVKAIQGIMVEEKYKNLRLVDISFGEDEHALSREKTETILSNYPDLKVLCAPTSAGIRAAAEVLQEQRSDVKLTGLGLPSEMAEFMTGDNPLCPVMYLWNPIAIGELSAYLSMALIDGTVSGDIGESFQVADGTLYQITESPLGGKEVIVGKPLEFTPGNIEQWKDVF